MAKYLQRSCPKCDGYLGIVVPEPKAKLPVQGDQWAVREMWLSVCLGVGSRDGTAPEDPISFCAMQWQLGD
jgi:hypothetical protein